MEYTNLCLGCIEEKEAVITFSVAVMKKILFLNRFYNCRLAPPCRINTCLGEF